MTQIHTTLQQHVFLWYLYWIISTRITVNWYRYSYLCVPCVGVRQCQNQASCCAVWESPLFHARPTHCTCKSPQHCLPSVQPSWLTWPTMGQAWRPYSTGWSKVVGDWEEIREEQCTGFDSVPNRAGCCRPAKECYTREDSSKFWCKCGVNLSRSLLAVTKHSVVFLKYCLGPTWKKQLYFSGIQLDMGSQMACF